MLRPVPPRATRGTPVVQLLSTRAAALAVCMTLSSLAAASNTAIPADVPSIRGVASAVAVREIAPGVHVVSDGIADALFVVTRNGVVVVDAPLSIGDRLSRAIRRTTPKRVTHLVYTSPGLERIGAADQFGLPLVRIADAGTAATLARLRDPRRAPPTRALADDRTLLLVGEMTLQLDRREAAREPGLTVWLPAQRVLVHTGAMPHADAYAPFAFARDVDGALAAAADALAYEPLHVVGTGAAAELGAEALRESAVISGILASTRPVDACTVALQQRRPRRAAPEARTLCEIVAFHRATTGFAWPEPSPDP